MTIVEDLDVLEDGRPGLLSGRPGLAMEQLGLESGEEALSDGIVPARPRPADALLEAVLGQPTGVGPGQVLAAADVVAVPSAYEEPFGLVVVEAMACGHPVVATRTGGIPELIRHGETGLLVPVHAPAELADAIERLLDDPALRRRLSRNGRRHVEACFTRERMARSMGRLYEQLVGEPR